MSQLSDRLADVRRRIHDAARSAGRDPDEVTVIAISKTFPVETIIEAAEIGISDFGENKAQEFAEKVDELSDFGGINWHFVGHLQRNKAKIVVGRARLVHGLDSERLAKTVGATAEGLAMTQECLIQINVSGEASKFGIEPPELPSLVDRVSNIQGIRIRGLMTLAAPDPDPEVVRGQFRHLKKLFDGLSGLGLEDADILSMGMSGDFEIAIEEGATHVRIGSAIFGMRTA